MSELDPTLAFKISESPDEPLDVIVRVDRDVDSCVEQLSSQGFEIRRKLYLIKGFAATATGLQVQELAYEPWVISIELDQQVRAL